MNTNARKLGNRSNMEKHDRAKMEEVNSDAIYSWRDKL